jgi:DNA-binding GntR family transcriptional regulator
MGQRAAQARKATAKAAAPKARLKKSAAPRVPSRINTLGEGKGRLVSAAAEELRRRIITGAFRPGDLLYETQLAEVLGMSRTPVREALGSLEQEGLVERRDGRGYFVAHIDPASFADLYDVRITLEKDAVRLAIERATEEDLKDIARLMELMHEQESRSHELEASKEIPLWMQFHERIAEAARMPFLKDCLSRLYAQMARFLWVESIFADDTDHTRKEHDDLYEAIAARDVDKAIAITIVHSERAKENMMRFARATQRFRGALAR